MNCLKRAFSREISYFLFFRVALFIRDSPGRIPSLGGSPSDFMFDVRHVYYLCIADSGKRTHVQMKGGLLILQNY